MNNWRIPTIGELSSLLDYRSSPACTLKDIEPRDFYWSSTVDPTNDEVNLIIVFNRGQTGGNYRTNRARLRPIRGTGRDIEWGSNSLKMTYEQAISYCKKLNDEKFA